MKNKLIKTNKIYESVFLCDICLFSFYDDNNEPDPHMRNFIKRGFGFTSYPIECDYYIRIINQNYYGFSIDKRKLNEQ